MDFAVRIAILDDVTGMGRVFADTFRAAHHGQIPDAHLSSRTSESSARGWADALRTLDAAENPDERIWVAIDESGEVIGIAMAGPAKPWAADGAVRASRPTGECNVLYVDVTRQRRGVGRALLAQVASFLSSKGWPRLVVGVLAANQPARSFYERVGGQLLGERKFDDSGVLLDEVVYVWEDLDSLLTRPRHTSGTP